MQKIESKRQHDFLEACQNIHCEKNMLKGIGTLKEKTIHATIKYFFEPRDEYHEQKVHGYVADIRNETGIIEIQTRNFRALRNKLAVFLENEQVTVVYPIPYKKWILWINEETGEVTNRRKSPKNGSVFDAFYELYQIKEYLTHPNLAICLLFIDMEEYRLLNGWSNDKKRGSTRYDRIPIQWIKEVWLKEQKDYMKFLQEVELPTTFTVKDFISHSKMSKRSVSCGIQILKETNLIVQTGKKGRAYLYKVREE